MLDTVVSVQMRVCIKDDINPTIENLVMAVRNEHIERTIVENLIQNLDNRLVEEFCGPKYSRNNEDKQFRRLGTKNRTIVTSVGELNLKLHRIKEKMGSNRALVYPINSTLEIRPRVMYMSDISMISTEFSTKMTYRDTKKEGELFTRMPSISTIQRRTIEYGQTMQVFNDEDMAGKKMKIVIPDGTKTHSQEPGKKKNDVNVVLGLKRGKKVLLGISVNKPWKDIGADMDKKRMISNKASIIGDGEAGMNSALVKEKRNFQMDLFHTSHTAGFNLWRDKELNIEDRRKIVDKLNRILHTLKNSVNKHIADKDFIRLQKRIDKTVDKMHKLAIKLERAGCYKTANFLRDVSNTIVTFAKLAIKGTIIPWTSNIVERLMGEISKRCKHKWMRWSTQGLESILTIILIRYVSEKKYQHYKDRIMRSENLTYISTNVDIISAPGGVF